jgi:uncharacterized membrane protein YkvA (DUF1232 family)
MAAGKTFLERWRQRVYRLKREVYALYLAYKDPRVPWYTRLFAGIVVAYAFSPIDLIPDPIPILGYLDDLVLIPLGIALAIRLLPPDILAECRQEAHRVMAEGKPTNWGAAAVIIAVWILLAAAAGVLVLRVIGRF